MIRPWLLLAIVIYLLLISMITGTLLYKYTYAIAYHDANWSRIRSNIIQVQNRKPPNPMIKGVRMIYAIDKHMCGNMIIIMEDYIYIVKGNCHE